jgi:hypothetical protein
VACTAAKASRSFPLWVKTGTFDPGRQWLYFRYYPKSGQTFARQQNVASCP